MGFGGEVDHVVEMLGSEKLVHEFLVADIAMDELEVLAAFDVFEGDAVPRIG
jgi:hypothetical protein